MSVRNLGSLAYEIYGQSSTPSKEIQPLIPRFRFQFTVSIFFGDGNVITTWNEENRSATLRVAGCTLPTHSAKMSTLNQYNKKRVIQTGVEYNPITITAYDTRNSELDGFLLAYHRHYYNGVMEGMDTKYINDVWYNTGGGSDASMGSFAQDIRSMSYADGSSQTGYKAPQDRHFIKRIEITRISSEEDIMTHTIFNPFIQNIAVDPLSYDDNNTMQYTLTFMYEGYSITQTEANIQGESGNPTPMDKQYLDRDEAWWSKITESGNPTPMHFQHDRNVDGTGSPTPFIDMGPRPLLRNGLKATEDDLQHIAKDLNTMRSADGEKLSESATPMYDKVRGESYIYTARGAVPNANNYAGERYDRLYVSDLEANTLRRDTVPSDNVTGKVQVGTVADVPQFNDTVSDNRVGTTQISTPAQTEKARLEESYYNTVYKLEETKIAAENKRIDVRNAEDVLGSATPEDYAELDSLERDVDTLTDRVDALDAEITALEAKDEAVKEAPSFIDSQVKYDAKIWNELSDYSE